ncbi:hypothetical protein M2459_001381 [Parabacteroides sp. PF5-5]|uniref:hypothetical protein n=1 Tax=unclassified Parabacteroides TaxID=2649774 RepID=UPI002476FFB4|nr:MULTISPECIES: hypothetical protein [unclassified Parabacteroides]MDH6304645.1 hypothetical protein [Parabacteroides sp. PH5-39]MDH6315741.1 hypothetical protein [Parabacteroides sp. PF5-13]MDH6319401.1 hypothetical protein [Parabacteroides sp. PH5-13]MDH6323132.1 hypothetical protein [Parabacteroides sp. PH5-8]MDH6326934.1 hypothetical protein [Parabacteroides sp. PH5-41]
MTTLSQIFTRFDQEDEGSEALKALKQREAESDLSEEIAFITSAPESIVCLTYNVDTREEAMRYAIVEHEYNL